MCIVCVFLQQIDYLTAQYTTAKNKVLSELDSKSKCCYYLSNVCPFVYLWITVVLSFIYVIFV